VEQLADVSAKLFNLFMEAESNGTQLGGQCYKLISKTGSVENVCYAGKHEDYRLGLELLTKRLTAAFLPPPEYPVLMQGRVELSLPRFRRVSKGWS
jgi:hypothetical protein